MVKGGGGWGLLPTFIATRPFYHIHNCHFERKLGLPHFPNQFRHKNDIERKIINQNWKIVDSNWDFELWAGDTILQFYIIYGRGGSCQDLGRGSKLGFSMKTMLRAYMYIPSSQANL